MTEPTAREIRQQIRHFRELLTARETKLQGYPRDELVREEFREINFWRNVLRDADARLTTLEESARTQVA